MAVIGALGDIVFAVSSNQIKTFDGLKWGSSVKYSEHARHMQEGLVEYTGTAADTIAFTMYLSVYLGVDPIEEITKLLNAERSGKVMPLVIGDKAYGKNKWMITKSDKALERFNKAGNLLTAKVTVSLIAYAAR